MNPERRKHICLVAKTFARQCNSGANIFVALHRMIAKNEGIECLVEVECACSLKSMMDFGIHGDQASFVYREKDRKLIITCAPFSIFGLIPCYAIAHLIGHFAAGHMKIAEKGTWYLPEEAEEREASLFALAFFALLDKNAHSDKKERAFLGANASFGRETIAIPEIPGKFLSVAAAQFFQGFYSENPSEQVYRNVEKEIKQIDDDFRL